LSEVRTGDNAHIDDPPLTEDQDDVSSPRIYIRVPDL